MKKIIIIAVHIFTTIIVAATIRWAITGIEEFPFRVATIAIMLVMWAWQTFMAITLVGFRRESEL